MITKLGGRKFIYAVLLTVIFAGLAAIGKISFEQLQSSLLWAYGIFAVANAGQKFAGK